MIEHRLYLMCTGIGLCYFHRIALFLKYFYVRCGSLFIMFAHSSFCVRALSADITVLSETSSYSIIKFSFYYSIVGINCPSMVLYYCLLIVVLTVFKSIFTILLLVFAAFLSMSTISLLVSTALLTVSVALSLVSTILLLVLATISRSYWFFLCYRHLLLCLSVSMAPCDNRNVSLFTRMPKSFFILIS